MTINLSSLIVKVQRELSDIPEDSLAPEVIYQSIQQADKFLAVIMSATTPASYLEWCIVMLGAYYAYLNYTSVVETRLGTLPGTSSIRLAELKNKAVTFITPYSNQQIDKDLNVNGDNGKVAPHSVGLMYKVTDDS